MIFCELAFIVIADTVDTNGEMFAGGGGVHTRAGYYGSQIGGWGGLGGGGGGSYSDSTSPPTGFGGNGGSGIVIIQYLTVS